MSAQPHLEVYSILVIHAQCFRQDFPMDEGNESKLRIGITNPGRSFSCRSQYDGLGAKLPGRGDFLRFFLQI